MKAKYNSDEEWSADRMMYLVGCTLAGVTIERTDHGDFPVLIFGDSVGRKFVVSVQSDAEGNDGGFLQIDADNEAAQGVMDKMERDQETARALAGCRHLGGRRTAGA